MKQSYTIINRKDSKIAPWSGGITEEIYITPAKAQYAKMNFNCRISLATVESTESEFTPLPKVNRTTMVLEGKLELQHKGEYSKVLEKFDQDSYPGSFETTSKGNSTNFNVMTRGKAQAKVEAFALEADEQVARPATGLTVMYVHSGRVGVILGKSAEVLETGMLIEITEGVPLLIAKALQESEVILTTL